MWRHMLVLAILAQASPGLAGVWTETFTGSNGSAPANWTISTSNGSMSIQSNTLYVSSQGSGYAWGYPTKSLFPALTAWNQSLPYSVEFDFMIPDANNHWFFVYADSRVHTVIDYGDDFTYRVGSSNTKIMDLGTNQWHRIRYDVVPAANYYDIYVDDVLRTSGVGFLPQNRDPFQIGDIHNGSYDHGSAYWDNFQLNIPEPCALIVWAVLGVMGSDMVLRRRVKATLPLEGKAYTIRRQPSALVDGYSI